MNSSLMFSKASDEWRTPRDFFAALDVEFGFRIDAAATAENAFCIPWFGLDFVPGGAPIDGLSIDWFEDYGPGPYWLNPPYSKCRQFIAKAAAEAKKGCTVVCLLPARTDTRYFHEHIYDASTHTWRPWVEVRFVKGRLKFGEGKNSAPFPSMVVIFRPV